MKKIILLVMALFLLTFVGCATIQTDLAKFDDQNMINTVSYAKQIMKHWQGNSQAIHIGIGDQMISTKLPAEFGSSLKALDDMAIIYIDPAKRDAMSESDAVKVIMYVGKLLAPAIQSLITQYAPDVMGQILKYLPSFMTL